MYRLSPYRAIHLSPVIEYRFFVIASIGILDVSMYRLSSIGDTFIAELSSIGYRRYSYRYRCIGYRDTFFRHRAHL